MRRSTLGDLALGSLAGLAGVGAHGLLHHVWSGVPWNGASLLLGLVGGSLLAGLLSAIDRTLPERPWRGGLLSIGLITTLAPAALLNLARSEAPVYDVSAAGTYAATELVGTAAFLGSLIVYVATRSASASGLGALASAAFALAWGRWLPFGGDTFDARTYLTIAVGAMVASFSLVEALEWTHRRRLLHESRPEMDEKESIQWSPDDPLVRR